MSIVPSNASLSGIARLLHTTQAGDVVVTHKSYTHDFEQGWHEHENGTIDFVIQGGGVGTYAGREVVSSPGTLEFFREGVRHRFRAFPSGIRSMHIVLPGMMLREIGALRDSMIEELRHTRAQALGVRVLSELQSSDRSSPLEIEALVHELIDEVTHVASRPIARAGWIGCVRDLLHSAIDRPISLVQVAREIGIDRAHLARTFRSRVGMSVGEYHRRIRIEHAARLLAEGDEPIARIAQRTGFADQAHLTRQFRARFETTPSAYRHCLRRR